MGDSFDSFVCRLDSFDMSRISETLSTVCGTRISPTVLFDYPSGEALVAYLDQRYGSAPLEPHSSICAILTTGQIDHPVRDMCASVAGVEFLSPGHVIHLGSLWQSMSSAHNSVHIIPVQRFDIKPRLGYILIHGNFEFVSK